MNFPRTTDKSIPPEEWDFTSDLVAKPPIWQWNDWLNYEYARSCRPIVEAVVRLRAPTVPECNDRNLPPPPQFPRHAIYLADNYPDFPLKPWLNLPQSQRNIRNQTGKPVGGPFEETIIEEWNAFNFAHRIATGDIWLDPENITDHDYVVFKINFLRDIKLIKKKFRHWLEQRQTRQRQSRATAEAVVDARVAAPPRRLKGSHRGQNQNQRKYTAAFNQLAALRLLEYFQWDHNKCVSETLVEPEMRPLYFAGNKSKWDQAAHQAAARLVHFHCMWSLEREPAYFYKFPEFHEAVKWQSNLQANLARTESPQKLKALMPTLFCGYLQRQELCNPLKTSNRPAI